MAEPFLRWAGGKRWLSATLADLMKGFAFDNYIEPFLGGGAMLFALEPKHAVISDINRELITAYQSVKWRPHALKKALSAIPVTAATYYNVRGSSPKTNFERSVRFIYLNRTCFGGLHRVNQSGIFNVPYGGGSRSQHVLTASTVLEEASRVLRCAEIYHSDFSDRMRFAGGHDLIFCDPTYVRKRRSAVFDRYNDKVFTWSDQVRLATACAGAVDRGASVIVSNVCCSEVRSLYPFARAARVARRSSLGRTRTESAALNEIVLFAGQRLLAHLDQFDLRAVA